MSSRCEIFSIKLKKEEYAKKFSELWNEILGEGDYLDNFDEETDIFSLFKEEDGEYSLCMEEEPLFACDEEGDQVDLMIKAFIQAIPNVELEAEYTCTFDNCSDAFYKAYQYSNNKLSIHDAYSEYGEGYECPECDVDLDVCLIKLSPEMYEDGFVCPHCGEQIDYEANVNEYVIDLIDGEWIYPDDFSDEDDIDDDEIDDEIDDE